MTSTEAPFFSLRLIEEHLTAIGALWILDRARRAVASPDEQAATARRVRAHLAGLGARPAEAARAAGLLLHAAAPAQIFAGMFTLLHLRPALVLSEQGAPRVRRKDLLPVLDALHYAQPPGRWAFAEASR